jgi:hypothetical protein
LKIIRIKELAGQGISKTSKNQQFARWLFEIPPPQRANRDYITELGILIFLILIY